MSVIAGTILIKRGDFADLPVLADGEGAFTLDTHQLFYGEGGVNYEIGGSTYTAGDGIDITGGVISFDPSALPIETIDDVEYVVSVVGGVPKRTNIEDFIPSSALSTDGTFTANSDTLIPSQKATKTYVDARATGTNTGDQLVFKTISVSGQSDVVADSTTDTLTLVGSGITITTNATTDTITFTASGIPDGDKGDITVSSSGTVWTIDNSTVTDAKLRDSAARSLIGRAGASSGAVADISAASDHQVLRRDGGDIGFGPINLLSGNAVTGTLGCDKGGTGLASFTTGATFYASSTSGIGQIAPGTTGDVYTSFSSGPGWVSPVYGSSTLGSDYTVTTSFATTGLSVTLPSAGTYELDCSARLYLVGNAGAYILLRLYDSTNSAVVTDSECFGCYLGANGEVSFTAPITPPVITVTGSTTIRLEAIYAGTATTKLVRSDGNGRSVLRYKRIKV